MNSEYCKQALAKVGNPNVLVNLISRRVRQLTSGAGGSSRPLLDNVQNLGAADIALLELIEGKMAYETPLIDKIQELPPPRRRRRPSLPR